MRLISIEAQAYQKRGLSRMASASADKTYQMTAGRRLLRGSVANGRTTRNVTAAWTARFEAQGP